MSARAGVVVTGTEVLTGRIQDRNGPWLADRLLELGVDLAHVTICGDRPADMEAQLRFLASERVDLVVTSGGLGPTADDLTAEIVARFQGRELVLDEALERRIRAIVEPLLSRWRNLDPDAISASTRKQALVPAGAEILEPAGTAPGLVVPPVRGDGPTIVVLPGPPRELQAMWREAVETAAFRAAVAGREQLNQHTLRLFGMPESEIAETLRVAERHLDGLDALEVTTCMRRGELEVVVRSGEGQEAVWEALRELIGERHGPLLYSPDGSTVDEQVAALLDGGSIAVAESCTGGLMAARLTDRPGSSAYVLGGVVAYSNEAKAALAGVDPALIDRHGAVSPEVADALAAGARTRFGAQVGVGITGVAGPGGGSDEKPVGTVCISARDGDGRVLARELRLPGDRREVRDRTTTVAMHLLRRILRGEADAAP